MILLVFFKDRQLPVFYSYFVNSHSFMIFIKMLYDIRKNVIVIKTESNETKN